MQRKGKPKPLGIRSLTSAFRHTDGPARSRDAHPLPPPPASGPAPLIAPNLTPPVEPVAAVLGIACPQCGSLLDRVFFTRRMTNHILRVRKCERCRIRVRTSERIVAVGSRQIRPS